MNRENEESVQCRHCGHVPRDKPVSGRWFCPRCGKANVVAQARRYQRPNLVQKSQQQQPSKDKIYTQLYDKLASLGRQDTPEPELGYKEPYINPPIPVIQPKERKKIKVFIPLKTDD
ncbi:MAG: hypothetical protein ACFFE8_14190 [Candidatus Heimdallarchaeota archaeon]